MQAGGLDWDESSQTYPAREFPHSKLPGYQKDIDILRVKTAGRCRRSVLVLVCNLALIVQLSGESQSPATRLDAFVAPRE